MTMYVLKLYKKQIGRVLKLLFSMGICLHEQGMTVIVSHVKPCVLDLNVIITAENCNLQVSQHI